MYRHIAFMVFIFSFCCLAEEPAADRKPTELNIEQKEIQSYITTLNKRVSRMEDNWDNTKSEVTRNLIQQQATNAMRTMAQKVEDFLDKTEAADTPEARKLAIDVIDTENGFFKSRLANISNDLPQLFDNYDSSSTDKQLMFLFDINNIYTYINWLLSGRQKNLERLKKLGVNITSEKGELDQELTLYVNFITAYLDNNNQRKILLEEELKNLPSDERKSMGNRIASQDRLVRSAVANLKQVVTIMEEQGLPVDQYNELIFETTGNLAEAVVSLETFRAVITSVWSDLGQWLKSNMTNVISRLLLFVGLMTSAVLLSRLVKRIILRAVTHKRAHFSTLVQDFFINTGGKFVIVVGILISLDQIGWNLTPLLTGLGVAGIVIGFALQDTLSNFASGMMILIYRPFDVGDYVEAAGVAGKVGKMTLVNTTIRTFDNQVFMVPNAKIWGQTIKNITSERIRRIDMVFGVSYDDHVEHVEQILEEIVSQHPKILKTPEHLIRLHLLSASSVDFIARPWVKTDDYWDVYWDITREVKVRFDREGITIPFPQQEVHLHQPYAVEEQQDEDISMQRSDTGLRAIGEGEDGR